MKKRKRNTGKCLGIITLDIFNLDVAVFERDEDRVVALRAQGCDSEAGNPASLSSAHMEFTGEGQIRLSMVIKPGVSGAIWAHECVHIADFVMDHLGIGMGVDCTEVRAYMVGHLFEHLERMIGGRKGKAA